jgi:hypothetical protein
VVRSIPAAPARLRKLAEDVAARNDAQRTILFAACIEMDSHRDHLRENLVRRLDMKRA